METCILTGVHDTDDHQYTNDQENDGYYDFDTGKPEFCFTKTFDTEQIQRKQDCQEQGCPQSGTGARKPVFYNNGTGDQLCRHRHGRTKPVRPAVGKAPGWINKTVCVCGKSTRHRILRGKFAKRCHHTIYNDSHDGIAHHGTTGARTPDGSAHGKKQSGTD